MVVAFALITVMWLTMLEWGLIAKFAVAELVTP